MAPSAQQDRADTSEALKPRAGPKIVTDTRMVSVISLELTEHQHVLVASILHGAQRWSIMEAEVADAAEDADDGTRVMMVRTGVANNFSSNSIFLGSKH